MNRRNLFKAFTGLLSLPLLSKSEKRTNGPVFKDTDDINRMTIIDRGFLKNDTGEWRLKGDGTFQIRAFDKYTTYANPAICDCSLLRTTNTVWVTCSDCTNNLYRRSHGEIRGRRRGNIR